MAETSSNPLARETFEILEDLDWNSSPKKKQAYERREASWRRMLIAQSPATMLRVARKSSLGTERLYEIRNGLRMKLLYDLVEKIRGYRISYFEMKWGTFAREDSKDGGIGTATNGNVGEGQSSITELKDRQIPWPKQRKPRDDLASELHYTT